MPELKHFDITEYSKAMEEALENCEARLASIAEDAKKDLRTVKAAALEMKLPEALLAKATLVYYSELDERQPVLLSGHQFVRLQMGHTECMLYTQQNYDTKELLPAGKYHVLVTILPVGGGNDGNR